MFDVLAVTPSPSIDREVVNPNFRLQHINRPEQVIVMAGGKGLNVARAVRRLGGSVKACLLLAGHNGRWITDQLEQEGIAFTAAWRPGETRVSTSIIDPKSPALTEIYERGEPVDSNSWQMFEEVLQNALADVNWVTFSGSLPPGAHPHGMFRMIESVHRAARPCAVDGRGEFLRNALAASPEIVKINASEAAEILSCEVNTSAEALSAAEAICGLGAGTTVITLGNQGAVAGGYYGRWVCRAPIVEVVAPVGSGDSFLGALILSLARGQGLPLALSWAVAAGAANAMTVGVANIDLSMVEQLRHSVQVQPA
jgi:1-phosphofructokinase family hexose kinase